MKRLLIGLVTAFGLLLGTSLPVSATIETPIRIDCSDGDSIELSVDLDTLTALTSSIAAINESDTDLTCSLIRLSAPVPVVSFGNVAAAASDSGYVIGAGKVRVGCPDGSGQLFTGSFAVKMYVKHGTLRGSGNLSVGSGQCVAEGRLSSTPTCLAISPTAVGGGRAWANSFVTSTRGAFFAPQLGKTIGWGFEDNGPHGGTIAKDRWRVEEKPGSCPVPEATMTDYYTLISGDLTVRP
jgi:hypothetical protein